MRRLTKLLNPLAAATTAGTAAPGHGPPAKGFLTIGTTTYIDPAGQYPLHHPSDGTATLVINDTDHYVTVVTERDRRAEPDAGPDAAPGTAPDIALAPGARTETRQGCSVQVGWGRVMEG
ncbi:hypothetical protein AB0D04_38955 [Streptomyces sp. NPDC048483]|uniref:hypothetical protein n=1 Tax=Streptomyces sp. NPDC048483 TaxID=3154927 RepID=UPI003418F138